MAIIQTYGFDGLSATIGGSAKAELNIRGLTTVDGSFAPPAAATGRGGFGKALGFSSGWSSTLIPLPVLTEGCISIAFSTTNYSGSGNWLRLSGVSGFIVVGGDSGSASRISLTGSGLNNSNSFARTLINLPMDVSLADFPLFQFRWDATTFELKCNDTIIHTRVFTGFDGLLGMKLGDGYNNSLAPCKYDDIVVQDTATFMPDDYRVGIAPLLSATTNDGTVTGAADAHVALSTFDGSTSYVTLNNPTDSVICPVTTIDDNPSAIYAVVVNRVARKTNTATVTENLLIETATSNIVGGDYSSLSMDYGNRQIVLTTDPHDATEWTKSKFNTLKVGIVKKA